MIVEKTTPQRTFTPSQDNCIVKKKLHNYNITSYNIIVLPGINENNSTNIIFSSILSAYQNYLFEKIKGSNLNFDNLD